MSSTAKMLFDLMVGISHAPKDISQADRRVINNSILLNNKIVTMHKSIDRLDAKRNSTYSIHTQVNELAPTLEANVLIKPETKSALKVRITNLLELLKQGITLDTNLTALDQVTVQLKDQLLDYIKAYFSKNKPEQDTVTEKDTITKTVEERSKEANLLIKSFDALYPQIGSHYEEIRRSTPGTLNLRSLTSLEAPHADAENAPAPRNE